MGGRGAYWQGASSKYETREFDQIGKIGRIKVIQPRDWVDNLAFPLYSNTKNTTYFTADKEGIIKSIEFYRDHKLIKSIDLTTQGNHLHMWVDSTVTRKGITTPSRKKANKEIPITSNRDKRLIEGAKTWNEKKDGT
ncbi:MAG: hypothetical protein IJI45_18255 [Anaerolineaceae bacterium]|nr:hypothetical protein [Anaerolineaceae bacterium]